MRRLSTVWLAMTWLVAGMPQTLASRPLAIPARATLRAVEVVDSPAGKEILLQIDGQYSFKTIHTPEGANYVDVQGARIGSISHSAHWGSGLLAGYQLMEYTDASGYRVVRVEIQTRGAEPPVAVQERSGLRLLLRQVGPASSGNPTPPAEVAVSSSGEAAKEPLLVSDVSITPGSEGEVTIDVATTKPAPFHVLRFDHPDRLVVDLEGARIRFRRSPIPVSSPVVRDVRVGQFKEKDPEVVRLVADLSGDPVFDAHAMAGGVHIEVKPRPRAASGAFAPGPAPKLQTAARREEGKPVQDAAQATEGADSSHVETQKEPARNQVSRNSIPAASPAMKDARVGKSQGGNPEAVPVLDDVLRLLFGQGEPAPGTATSRAKGAQPFPVERLKGPSLVSDILVSQGSAGEITIDVVMTKSSPIQVLRIGHPDRLVVDVKGARNRCPRHSIPVASPVVKGVRLRQFEAESPEVVRVVVDLSGNPICDAHAYAGGVRIEVKPRPTARWPSPASPMAASRGALPLRAAIAGLQP
jgi:hypothetical protein